MINPTAIFKVKGLWEKFTINHPKFMPFLAAVNRRGITEGTIIEISVTTPDGEKVATNIKINSEDMELFAELKRLA